MRWGFPYVNATPEATNAKNLVLGKPCRREFFMNNSFIILILTVFSLTTLDLTKY